MTNSELSGMLREIREAVTEAGFDLDSAAGAAAISSLIQARVAGSHTVSSPAAEASIDTTSPASRVAKWLSVDPELLYDVIDFGEDRPELVLWERKLPKGKADRQRVLAAIRLAVDRVGYRREETDARAINALCERYDCLDQNLPKNLRARDLVTRKGQRGAYVYRLTHAGLPQAKAILEEVLSDKG